MIPKTWLFEGEQRTAAQVHKMVPALSDMGVRRLLDKGAKTIVEMLAPRRAQKKPTPAAQAYRFARKGP